LKIMGDPEIAESGGAHNQKGIEFQKNWAIKKMFALYEEVGREDFIFLFEAIQDIAVLDSSTKPTAIEIYQVKKKDRKEWTWGLLTNLHAPADPLAVPKRRSTAKTKPVTGISDSPIGKLFAAMAAFDALTTSASFVSNAGCDLDLEGEGNAASAELVDMSKLLPHYRELLQSALDSVQKPGHQKSDLSKVSLEKADLAVGDPRAQSEAAALRYLTAHSKRHAGQAIAFVDSLLAKLGPLSAKTGKAKTIEEMISKRGYSFQQFKSALGDLQQTPDTIFYLNMLLEKMSGEGLKIFEIMRIRAASTSIYSRMLMRTPLPEEPAVKTACDDWLDGNELEEPLLPFMENGVSHLRANFTSMKSHELQAHLLLRAIDRCVDPN